jgi:hypothetical protein
MVAIAPQSKEGKQDGPGQDGELPAHLINDPGNRDRFVELRKGFFPEDNYPGSALIAVSHFAVWHL